MPYLFLKCAQFVYYYVVVYFHEKNKHVFFGIFFICIYTYGKGGCICAQLHMMFVTIRGSTAIAWFNQSGKNLLFLGKMYHFFTKFCLKSSRKSVGILFWGGLENLNMLMNKVG